MGAVKSSLGVAAFVSGVIAGTPALAWHHGGHAHLGVYIGAPAYWHPRHYYPPYYPPVLVIPSAPPTYIEQGSAQAAPAPAQSNWWYYCAEAKAYYPCVRACPAGWQPVAPQPPSPAGGNKQ